MNTIIYTAYFSHNSRPGNFLLLQETRITRNKAVHDR